MASYPVRSTTLNGTANFIATGSFSDPNNPATPLTWTGYVTTTMQNGWTGYAGDTGGELGAVGYTVASNNAALVSAGFPALASLAFKGNGQPDATVSDTIGYGFSAPLSAGTHFYLWDPGASYNNETSSSTFTFTASNGGKAVDTSGWTFTTINAQGGNPLTGSYTVNAATGSVSVSGYVGAFQPEAVIEVTTSNAIDKLTMVANTIGADVFGLSVAAPGSVTSDTVTGANGTIDTLAYDSATAGTQAQALMNAISTGIANNTLVAYVAGTTQPVPGGSVGTVQQVDTSSLVAMGTDIGLIDDAAGPVTAFGGASANESVVAAMGGLTFVAGTPAQTQGQQNAVVSSGQIVAGGSNTFIEEPGLVGNWNMTFGVGNDTVVALSGNDTISGGTGANLIFLGAGKNLVNSTGVDTIVGGAGTATINASAGVGTIGALAFGNAGGLTFVGGAGVATVVSLGGSMTVQSGAGGGLYFGGTGGNNLITSGSGPATMFGGGGGDLLSATGSAGNLLAARAGNETLTGAGSTGNNSFFAGTANDLLVGGAGNNSFSEGAGSSTMVGGSGLNLFVFNAGVSTGQADTIDNWNPAHDFVSLQGYGPGADTAALKTASFGNGNETLTLADGTHLIFVGVTSLAASSLV